MARPLTFREKYYLYWECEKVVGRAEREARETIARLDEELKLRATERDTKKYLMQEEN